MGTRTGALLRIMRFCELHTEHKMGIAKKYLVKYR